MTTDDEKPDEEANGPAPRILLRGQPTFFVCRHAQIGELLPRLAAGELGSWSPRAASAVVTGIVSSTLPSDLMSCGFSISLRITREPPPPAQVGLRQLRQSQARWPPRRRGL